MVSIKKETPRKATSNQDSSDISPQPRMASGTLPPEAAHAPEFVPGKTYQPFVSSQHTDNQKGDQKSSEAGSDKEVAPRKKPKALMKAEKKAEKGAEEKAQKQKALDEEWWSGDEIFVPDLKDKDGLEDSEKA